MRQDTLKPTKLTNGKWRSIIGKKWQQKETRAVKKDAAEGLGQLTIFFTRRAGVELFCSHFPDNDLYSWFSYEHLGRHVLVIVLGVFKPYEVPICG